MSAGGNSRKNAARNPKLLQKRASLNKKFAGKDQTAAARENKITELALAPTTDTHFTFLCNKHISSDRRSTVHPPGGWNVGLGAQPWSVVSIDGQREAGSVGKVGRVLRLGYEYREMR
jgi:hypothetical protein